MPYRQGRQVLSIHFEPSFKGLDPVHPAMAMPSTEPDIPDRDSEDYESYLAEKIAEEELRLRI